MVDGMMACEVMSCFQLVHHKDSQSDRSIITEVYFNGQPPAPPSILCRNHGRQGTRHPAQNHWLRVNVTALSRFPENPNDPMLMLASSRVISVKVSRFWCANCRVVSHDAFVRTFSHKNDSSSSSSSSSASSVTPPSAPAQLLLYERSPEGYTLMRCGLGFSSFHSAYWLWYTTDFIPLVNASPIPELHTDPSLGIAGFAFAMAIQAIFFLYPKRLVSKLELRDNRDLILYTHSLPWIRPAAQGKTVPLGELMLDPSSPELQTVWNDCQGDLRRYRGFLGVGRRWPPYVLDIREDRNVPHPDELLSALLYPEELQKQAGRNSATTATPRTTKSPKASKLRRIGRRR